MIVAARQFGRQVAAWSPFTRTLALSGALAASAVGMAVASGSSNLGWVGWITLLPLFQAIRVLSPGCAAIAGAFWGVCLCGAASQIGGSPLRVDLLGFALLAVIPGAYTGLGAALTQRVGFSPYLLALGWIGVEFALHPLGLRNGLLAATLGDGFALRVLGSFAGYVLVAFVVAYINAALLCVLIQVRFSAGTTRFATGRSGGVRSKSSGDAFVPLRAFLRLAQPRGPPAFAPACASRR